MNIDAMHRLPDGRRLGYASHGMPDGRPILYCHGTPGSRLSITPAMARTARELGAWLIAPDRPGYGRSDPQPGRSLADWCLDVANLMDGLGVARFGVLGYSSGTVYALSCAGLLRERVTSASLLGSLVPNLLAPELAEVMAPAVLGTLTLARDDPEQLRQRFAPFSQAPEQLFQLLAGSFAPVDQPVLAQPEVADAFRRDCRESVAQGVEAMVWDFVLATGNLGYGLKTVRTPVAIWQGLADINTPPAMARHLAERLPRCRLHEVPGEGHLCLYAHWGEVLAEVSGELASLREGRRNPSEPRRIRG